MIYEKSQTLNWDNILFHEILQPFALYNFNDGIVFYDLQYICNTYSWGFLQICKYDRIDGFYVEILLKI